jgi:hypothetical protein
VTVITSSDGRALFGYSNFYIRMTVLSELLTIIDPNDIQNILVIPKNETEIIDQASSEAEWRRGLNKQV